MQERSHAFAMKSQFWLLDPRPNLPSIVKAVGDGFALSEASNSPVMLTMRIRSCHVTGSFATRDNQRPKLSVRDALSNPRSDFARVVLPPMSYVHEQDKVKNRWPAAEKFIQDNRLNEMFGTGGRVGIVCQGGMYNGVIRALQRLGLADIYGETRVPIYCLNVTYPLISSEFLCFADGKDAILVVEEGQPEFIEQTLSTYLYRAGSTVKLYGKGVFPMAGEYTGAVMLDGVEGFLRAAAPEMLPAAVRAPNQDRPAIPDLTKSVPIRPPGFCTGCPERPIFAAMKLVQKDLGKHQISADIGCHLFGALPPFEIGGATMGYGLGPAGNGAFDGGGEKRPISIIGDGGFWHSGLSSSMTNMVFNKSDGVVMVVDNYYSAATGGQDVMSSRADNATKATNHPISKAMKGVGVNWVRQVDRTYDVPQLRKILHEALTTKEPGPKVIIASSECMLNKQRREKPLRAAAIKEGRRVEAPRFGVDEAICTGDHACIRLSGCPSLSLKRLDDPLRDDPVASIDQSCVGCGNCGEVADAAVLCPSFYRADVVHNPGRFEAWWAAQRARVIGWLVARRAAKRLEFSA
jgi:indolepyruvate ferredoxin oxidoreductase, alpha subunit